MTEKICDNCQTPRPLTGFSPAKTSADGLKATCKICRNADRRAYIEANLEHVRALKQANHLRHKAAANQKSSRYYYANKAQLMPKFRAYTKAYRKRNPDRARSYSRNANAKRRAVMNSASATATSADVQEVLRLAKGRCHYCQHKVKRLEIEHVIPLSRGGSHSRDNLVAACKKCNMSKHANDPMEFAKEIGRLLI